MIHMRKAKHSIRVASRVSGVSPHLIRMWERRYGAVSPVRTETNRRVYSDLDIKKLLLLHKATMLGESIGNIANLPIEDLEAIVEDLKPSQSDSALTSKTPPIESPREEREFMKDCIDAVLDFDGSRLEDLLVRASVELGNQTFIENLVVPLLYEIGEMWERGEMRVAQEHLATAVLRTMIGGMIGGQNASSSGPHVTVTTPAGYIHENGALVAAATAASDGWRVSYLGPSLPAEEIAQAVQRMGSKVLALSLIYPSDDPHLVGELTKIRRVVPNDTAVIVGGRAARSFEADIKSQDIVIVDDLASFKSKLREVRYGMPS